MAGMDEEQEKPVFPEGDSSRSTVYGPVHSWRVGWSLGIDLILVNSICSFNCVYCQLGRIRVHTLERKLFVPTHRVRQDLVQSDWRKADVVTFSGSGEPTLALNLGEAVEAVRDLTGKPQVILTNGTLLHDPQVRQDAARADRVFVKLDAASETTFRRINRPVQGITLESVVAGAEQFRREFQGWLGVQIMFLPNSRDPVEAYLPLLQRIGPNEIQVNTPTRPYPGDEWHLESRGSHGEVRYPARPLKTLSPQRLAEIEDYFEKTLPGVVIRRVPTRRKT